MRPPRLAPLAVLALLLASATSAQPSRSPSADDLQRLLDGRIPAALEAHGVPSAAVAAVRDGEVVFSGVWGEQSPGVPATEHTRYDVASLTKPVASEVVLGLASAGLLSLDEPMAGHWVDPDLADDPRHRALTPRVALAHRTGFTNWRYETDGVLQFQHDPGTRTGYSGEGFDYVVRFVEEKMDAPFEAVAREHLLGPAGMDRTAFTGDGVPAEHLAWSADAEGAWIEPRTMDRPSGADGLRTTAGDYARFLARVLGGEGVSQTVAAERLTMADDLLDTEPCPTDKLDGLACPDRVGFGLSWLLFEYPGETVVFHNGADTGERTLALWVPERDLGVVVLTNGANGDAVIFDAVRALYDHEAWVRLMAPTPG